MKLNRAFKIRKKIINALSKFELKIRTTNIKVQEGKEEDTRLLNMTLNEALQQYNEVTLILSRLNKRINKVNVEAKNIIQYIGILNNTLSMYDDIARTLKTTNLETVDSNNNVTKYKLIVPHNQYDEVIKTMRKQKTEFEDALTEFNAITDVDFDETCLEKYSWL